MSVLSTPKSCPRVTPSPFELLLRLVSSIPDITVVTRLMVAPPNEADAKVGMVRHHVPDSLRGVMHNPSFLITAVIILMKNEKLALCLFAANVTMGVFIFYKQ